MVYLSLVKCWMIFKSTFCVSKIYLCHPTNDVTPFSMLLPQKSNQNKHTHHLTLTCAVWETPNATTHDLSYFNYGFCNAYTTCGACVRVCVCVRCVVCCMWYLVCVLQLTWTAYAIECYASGLDTCKNTGVTSHRFFWSNWVYSERSHNVHVHPYTQACAQCSREWAPRRRRRSICCVVAHKSKRPADEHNAESRTQHKALLLCGVANYPCRVDDTVYLSLSLCL